MREEMRKKPKGQRYRNLSPRRGAIYYERLWNGRRYCFSTKTADWDQAVAVRDLYELRKGIGNTQLFAGEVAKFEAFAQRYLSEDTDHLAPTTRGDRAREVRPSGRLVSFFGTTPIDEITTALIREYWSEHVQGANRSTKTGRNDLDTLAGILGYAIDLGLIEANPVDAFRAVLRRKARTQRGRVESAAGRDIRPIEDPAEIEQLVASARDEGPTAYLLVLLLLDAGLRLGETLGLRWGSVTWGGDDDPHRCLLIEESRPRGGKPGPTKSGRGRRVDLSMRLRSALFEHYRAAFAPGPTIHVLPGVDPAHFRNRGWRRILERADIGHRKLKDLRDTFASQLLSAGVQLGYVSQQLGHADVAVTARHYARWVGGDQYREPLRLEPGEVPADLLSRLSESQRSPNTWLLSDEESDVSTWNYGVGEGTRTPGFQDHNLAL